MKTVVMFLVLSLALPVAIGMLIAKGDRAPARAHRLAPSSSSTVATR
jgi:hypothetical protein